MRPSGPILVLFCAALLSCSSSSTPSGDNAGDAGPLLGSDAGSDATMGSPGDAGSDSGREGGMSDAGVDAGPITGNDGGNDASVAADSGSESGSGVDASFVEAPHPSLPILINNGGVVLHTPKIVTITFPGDADMATYQAFGATATNNAWWDAIRKDYCDFGSSSSCVGDGPPGTSVELTTPPAASYADSQDPTATVSLKSFIQSLIPATIPQPDAQTLLAFYFPTSTTITLDSAKSCQAFGGYHNSMTVNGVTFAYAIMPECAAAPQQTLTVAQETILAASHEFAEAATDPFTPNAYYLNFNDPAIAPWNALAGGEVGDMCFDLLGLRQDETTENGFIVQRSWSNLHALAGLDPCVPAAAAPYFSIAPEMWLLTATPGGPPVTMQGDAFSEAATAAWIVHGDDDNATQANPNPYLTITFNGAKTATVQNGDKVTIGVTLNQDPGALTGTVGGAIGLIISADGPTVATSTKGHVWPFMVTSPADALDAGLNMVDAAQDLPRRMQAMTSDQRSKVQRMLRRLR